MKGDFWSAVKWGLGIGLGIVAVRLFVEAVSGAVPLAVDYLQGKTTTPPPSLPTGRGNGAAASSPSSLPPQMG